MPSFIETQFPIARLSAESYKERKSGAGQTLTGLGKWWGRKPLILVRASIIGMIMPASNDLKKDREIFLKILTMDDDGAWHRQKGDIPVSAWIEVAPLEIAEKYFTARGFQRGLNDEEKQEALDLIWESLDDSAREALDNQRRRPISDRAEFDVMPYAERITHCERPENVSGPSDAAWRDINAHLDTTARTLQELVEQLGQREFGHTPRVGDSFCGGGSIPFEAAHIGCEAFGSDLNPVAGLLTWASINLLGGGADMQEEVAKVLQETFDQTDKLITKWGIEHNNQGERAEAHLYCVELKPEGCDYYIPLAPSWIISEKYRIVCTWQRIEGSDRLQPNCIIVSPKELEAYKKKKGATVINSRVIDPFDSERSWSVESLRGLGGLRRWTNDDFTPRSGDVFQERLYCIRWSKTITNTAANGKTSEKLMRRYAAPDEDDLKREAQVIELLKGHFSDWQDKGFIPSKKIISGYNTDQPTRERGWTHWHHLFTPRQLLMYGCYIQATPHSASIFSKTAALLKVATQTNWNSKLNVWNANLGKGGGAGYSEQTFANQALNTLFNFGTRSFGNLKESLLKESSYTHFDRSRAEITLCDAREINKECDIWITDPPYADAVNYHELGDFFLAWYDKQLAKLFPKWIPDSRAELAVKGDGNDFRASMVEIYKNLARKMPENGMQMVQFTHQNPAVWADLGMILWAAGLKATAAWTISTETAAGLKKGNYVQGTVCLVLRKRVNPEPGFLDEVYPLVEDEVRRQVASMQSLDQDAEPNFNDADYSLAAYAAALKVLTQYASLDGQDVEHEVFAVRCKNEKSAFQTVIERAIAIACDTLVPKGLEELWTDLSLAERYYLRALDIESRGERRKGMYEELARGFGVKDLRPLLKSDTANGTRMQTAKGMGKRNLDAPAVEGGDTVTGAHPFGCTPLRHLLFAIHETGQADNDPEPGRQYLRDAFGPGYWAQRERFVYLLEWITALANTEDLREWQQDSDAARILTGRLRNDHD